MDAKSASRNQTPILENINKATTAATNPLEFSKKGTANSASSRPIGSYKNEALQDDHLYLPNSASNSSTNLRFKVINGKNIKGSKGEHSNLLVRVQFADLDFKDSPIINDTANPEFNFSYEQNFVIDESFIDMLANKKLLITVIESLPKEKTSVLGTCETGLYYSFLKKVVAPNDGHSNLSSTFSIPMNSLNQKSLKEVDEISKGYPELEVEVSIDTPLLTREESDDGMFLILKVDDLWPTPDEWTLKEGSEKDINSNIFGYTLKINLPREKGRDRNVTIQNGLLVATENIANNETGTPQAVMMPKDDPNTQGLYKAGHKGAKKDSSLIDESLAGTGQDLAPLNNRKVIWGATHIAWLSPSAVKLWREQARGQIPMVVHFNRELLPRFAHVMDTAEQKYKGNLKIDLSTLLFPRVTGIKGRYQMENMDGSQVTLHENGSAHKSRTAGNSYKHLQSTVAMEITLSKPLWDKKLMQPIAKSVKDFIPKRVLPPDMAFEKRSLKADESYRAEIQLIVKKLIIEYQDAIQKDLISHGVSDSLFTPSATADEQQTKKKMFLFHLNRSGEYFAFKERLKSAVVSVVRERFHQKSPFASKEEMQLFMGDIYLYLVEQMHIAIQSMFSSRPSNAELKKDEPQDELTALKKFADEAEKCFQIPVATSLHQERVSRFEDDLQTWYDYGCFLRRNECTAKGEECFREILARNSYHLPALLALGAVCCSNEKYEETLVYLDTALLIHPKHPIGLVLMSLYYDAIFDEKEAERYLNLAKSVHDESNKAKSLFIMNAEFLIQVHASQLAERVLAQELLTSSTIEPFLLLSQLDIQRRNFSASEDHLKSALAILQSDPYAWAAMGHLQYIQKQWDDAKMSYETVLSFAPDDYDLSWIHTRLGDIFLKSIENDKSIEESNQKAIYAKSMFLRSCEANPTCKSWLGVGKSCIILNELDQAEDALAEANVLNNRDSEVWSFIALLSLKQERAFEANQSIAQALRLGVRDISVLKLVGAEFFKAGFVLPAIECYRMCLELEPDNLILREAFIKALDVSNKNIGSERKLEDIRTRASGLTI